MQQLIDLRASLAERARADGGFTLIEVTVALMMAVVLLVSLTLAVGNAMQAVRQNRTLQQATSLAIERIEYTRSVPWANLANDTTVLGIDPLLLTGPPRQLDGTQVGGTSAEDLVEDTVDGWVDTYRTEGLDETTFDVATYITDAGAGLRRVTVLVEWTIGNNDRRHFTSALIAEVSAG